MIRITDSHAPRLLKMAPALLRPAMLDEVEGGAHAIVDEAVFSIEDGAISGSAHVVSLPGEAPNRDSGVLSASGHVSDVTETGDRFTGAAVFDADYAGFLERGTSRMEPRPFLGPAARRLHDEIIRSVRQRLRDVRT